MKTEIRDQESYSRDHRVERFCWVLLIFLIFSILFSCAKPPQQPPPELYWPSPPARPRIKYLEKWSGKDDFGRGSPILE